MRIGKVFQRVSDIIDHGLIIDGSLSEFNFSGSD